MRPEAPAGALPRAQEGLREAAAAPAAGAGAGGDHADPGLKARAAAVKRSKLCTPWLALLLLLACAGGEAPPGRRSYGAVPAGQGTTEGMAGPAPRAWRGSRAPMANRATTAGSGR